ncbi:MAG: acylneuraminate cytidylyltransferase family protein [Myxococcales bacterium]|nr:acylneuraminate cytidylyltransferase family protein [Myxococcales bacterium]
MAYRGRSVLAIVPARGGSKGIPRKNLAVVGDRSLIAHAAATIAALPWIDASAISTDDDAMAAEGERGGLAAPFRRPPELANDTASAADAWRHAWVASEAHFGRTFDVGLWLQPTTPLRDPRDVERTLAAMVEGGFGSAASVSEIPAHLRPERAMTLGPDGELGFYLPAGRGIANRQEIPATWYRNGVCYAATRETVVELGQTVALRAAGVPVAGTVVSIDEPFDLELCNLLWERARRAGEGGAS